MGICLDRTTEIHETPIDVCPDRLLLGRRVHDLQHSQHCHTGGEFISPSVVQGDNNRLGSSLTHCLALPSSREWHNQRHDALLCLDDSTRGDNLSACYAQTGGYRKRW